MTTRRIRDEVALQVRYADRTRYGSAVTGLIDALITRTCAPLVELARRHGVARLVEGTDRFMAQILAPQALGGLYERRDALREECLYPAAEQVEPAALVVHGLGATGEGVVSVPLGGDAAELGDVIASLERGCTRPRSGLGARVFDALASVGALTEVDEPAVGLGDGITFIGHAGVAVQAGGARVLVDPFAVAPRPGDVLRPLPCRALRPDLVLITHSHPDHFDLDALLRFGPDTTIVVPEVARESLCSVDMALRLRELGFRRVRTLGWYDELRHGAFRAIALPFFGEQPTSREFLHPEARNLGNTYVIEAGGRRIGCIADAGADAAGTAVSVAAEARRRHGALDVLFGGYRAWRMHPLEFLGTSVARYLLQVPRAQWGVRQQLMNDADDLLDTATAWGASTVVPYANGGAPWFARIGLGPHGDDDPNFDPDLATVLTAAARRTHAPAIRALRAGERMEAA